jgi:hypothetical protein
VLKRNPRKTVSVRELGMIDIAPLREAVLAIPEQVWNAENEDKPNRFDALDCTQHMVFRFITNPRDWRQSFDRPAWDEWKDLVEPVIREATAPYGYARGAFPRIMLARMAPGGVIHPHWDQNRSARWPHKIHIPIVTNDQVSFLVDDTYYHFAEGQAVEVNNLAVHAVENKGSDYRIHLIFEYYDLDQPEPDWIAELVAVPRN